MTGAAAITPPDLQEWINRYGGYHAIPWKEWHSANAAYQAERSRQIVGDIDQSVRKLARRS
jgi:hypothetical protein